VRWFGGFFTHTIPDRSSDVGTIIWTYLNRNCGARRINDSVCVCCRARGCVTRIPFRCDRQGQKSRTPTNRTPSDPGRDRRGRVQEVECDVRIGIWQQCRRSPDRGRARLYRLRAVSRRSFSGHVPARTRESGKYPSALAEANRGFAILQSLIDGVVKEKFLPAGRADGMVILNWAFVQVSQDCCLTDRSLEWPTTISRAMTRSNRLYASSNF
jgi:hypothetical protein